MLNDLLKGKTWLVWDGETAVATITVDTDEPVDLNEQPVWPEHERHRSALYVRRVVVSQDLRRAADWAPRYWTGRPTWRKETTRPR